MSNLIILRGNSGSGKTSVAKALQTELGPGTMLISQDVIRREILNIEDKAGNPAIELIGNLVAFGDKYVTTVILEGILSTKKYGEMLNEAVNSFSGNVHAYYFDVSFEETLRRHKMKPNSHEFGEEEMRLWWKDQDHLKIEKEWLISESMDVQEAMALIIENLRNK